MLAHPGHEKPAINIAPVACGLEVLDAIIRFVAVEMIDMHLALAAASPSKRRSAPIASMAASTMSLEKNTPVLVQNAARAGCWVPFPVACEIAVIGQPRWAPLPFFGRARSPAPEIMLVAQGRELGANDCLASVHFAFHPSRTGHLLLVVHVAIRVLGGMDCNPDCNLGKGAWSMADFRDHFRSI